MSLRAQTWIPRGEYEGIISILRDGNVKLLEDNGIIDARGSEVNVGFTLCSRIAEEVSVSAPKHFVFPLH